MTEDKISLAHGAGGSMTMKLIEDVILKEFSLKKQGEGGLDELDDGASLKVGDNTLVFSTDSHTVKPLFFPGGDIGRLSVAGTVNDLAVMGGKPLAMACAMVLREGYPVEDFRKICRSMDATSREADVPLVTGDTKVMERDALDEMIITTTGVGVVNSLKTDAGLQPGDTIIVTGNIGNHGAAILTHREGIEIEGEIESDVAPLWGVVEAALGGGRVSSMKDPTRGGLSGALNEIASKSGVGISIDESKIPISDPVRSVVEMLGLDPLTLTNEGKVVMGIASDDCISVLDAVRKTKYGEEACVIGEATKDHPGKVMMRTAVGGKRLVRATIGDPVPRIC